MEKEFWLKRWEDNIIGFHRDNFSEHLTKYWDQFASTKEAVFVPLCGKSKDLLYFVSQGHNVIGVELSEKAIVDFFEENKISFNIHKDNGLTAYTSEKIKIYSNNLFDLSFTELMNIKYVYDRAALVALPEEIRLKYAKWFCTELRDVKIFLETINNEGTTSPPPFYVSNSWVDTNYSAFERTPIFEEGSFNLNFLSPLE